MAKDGRGCQGPQFPAGQQVAREFSGLPPARRQGTFSVTWPLRALREKAAWP